MKSLLVAMQQSCKNFSSETIAFLVFVLCILMSISSSAQNDQALRKANEYLAQHKTELGLSSTDISDLLVKNAYTDAHNGVTHAYIQQRHNGIEIKNAILGLHYREGGEVLYAANGFQKKTDSRLVKGTPAITPEHALQIAAQSLDLQLVTAPKVLSSERSAARETMLSNAGISQNDIPAKLMYYPAEDGTLRLAWEMQIYTKNSQNYWIAAVDARDGRLLSSEDLVIKCNFNHDHAEDNCGKGQLAFAHAGSAAVPGADANFFSQENENIRTVFGENSMLAGNFYRVYNAPVETPNHGNRTLVNTSGDPVASPFGWHYDGNVSYAITKGNNVHAYEDKLGANAGTSPLGGLPGQTLFFDFPLNLSQQPGTYTNAAVTNLFFWNNYIHDVMYGYGFTEAAGNFQFNNLGKGGVGGDAVMAEAQDGGGTNNANFLTLPDGVPGRMQMYLWTSNQPAEVVHIENSSTYPSGGVSFIGIPAAFGAEITTTGVTGELVIVEANQNSASSCNPCGCGTGAGVGLPPNNNVQGKIVLIDRGDCTFIEKVMGAQMGGAIGVIVANNIPGADPIAMGGDETGNAILIPAAMISFEDGLELKDEIALGSVTTSLRRLTPAPPMKDGDLDNGIITHEYGHGISIRLTGGPGTNCLSGQEQAGEGWSDYFGLMLTMNPATIATIGAEGRGVGSYVFDQPITGTGIRPAKYSTNISVNSYTYGDINNPEISVPHGVGFVFATALWEMTWNLIDAYGYDTNINSGNLSKGNVLALQLVIDGLKMQPCGPTFLQSRDAILAADQALTGGANQCLIWAAFAKRGMGFSAVSGTNSRGDEIEAFDMPPSCLPNVKIVKSAPAQIGNGQNLTYTLSVSNLGGVTAHGVVVTDPIPAGTSYVSGSASHGGSLVGNVVTFPATSLAPGQTKNYTFSVTVNTSTTSNLLFADNMEDGINQWTFSQGVDIWNYTDTDSKSGNFSWFAADPDNFSNQTLEIASPVTLNSGSQLRFWHKFDTESGFDGGRVEITNDGGITWYDLGPQMIQNGYNDFIPLANNPLINGFAFGGSSNGWIQTIVNLSPFNGQQVTIRFRFSSDVATPGVGWYVDDVVIGNNITVVNNTASFVTALGETGSSSVSTLVVAPGQNLGAPAGNGATQPQFTNALRSDLKITAYPNPARDVINLQLEGELSGDVQLNVMNTQGQIVQRQTFAADEINPVISLNSSDLPTGMYWISVRDDLNMQTVKVMVERN